MVAIAALPCTIILANKGNSRGHMGIGIALLIDTVMILVIFV